MKKIIKKVIEDSKEQLVKFGDLSGNHHPYCAYTYGQFRVGHWNRWQCICSILKAYDKWRNQTC